MFVAVPGLAIATFVLAFTVTGFRETAIAENVTGSSDSTGNAADASLETTPSATGTLIRMVFVIVATSVILIEPAFITPHWLQYSLLILVPGALGYVTRRVIASRMSQPQG